MLVDAGRSRCSAACRDIALRDSHLDRWLLHFLDRLLLHFLYKCLRKSYTDSTGLLARRLRLAYTAIATIAAIALQPFASCITQKLSHVWQHYICIVTCSKFDE